MNKSKKLIETIYTKTPSDDISSIMGNISKLLYQFQTSPQKLPKAAPVLEKHALGCIKVLNMPLVRVTVIVFSELIKGTREHLSLFEDVIASVTTAYCASPSLEVRCSGISIFAAYVDALDATSAPASRLDFFSYAALFIKFAKLPTAAANNKLKVASFQGLSACVRACELRNAMETFIGKLGQDTVTTILENVHSFTPKKPLESNDGAEHAKSKKSKKEDAGESGKDGNSDNDVDDETKEISAAATQCLRDLVERLESVAISSLVDHVLQYFDTKNIWSADSSDNEFADNCLLAILKSIKSTNRYLMVDAVVQRIEKVPAGTPVAVRARMFTCLEKVYTEATRLFSRVLHVTMRHLDASIAAAGKEDGDEEAEFQRHLIQVVSKIAGKVSLTATKIEGIELVISKAFEHMKGVLSPKSKSGDGAAATDIVVAFLDLANELFATIKRPFSRRPNDSVVTALLRFSEAESAPEVRFGALKLLEIVLSCGQNDTILKDPSTDTIASPTSSESAGPKFMGGTISLDDPAIINGVGVRDTLLKSLALGTNKPQHVAEIGGILVILLARLQDREIPFAVPYLFEVQSDACKSERATSLDRARMVLVAACLVAIARIYGADDLRKLALDALGALDDEGLASKELRVDPERANPLVQAHSKWRKPYESEGPMKPVFDRARVVSILAGIRKLARGYVNFQSMLDAKWEDVVSGDAAIEMLVGKSGDAVDSDDSKGKSGKKRSVGKHQQQHKRSAGSDDSDDSDVSDDDIGNTKDGSYRQRYHHNRSYSAINGGSTESRSHLVSLTRLSSYSVSLVSDSIAEIPFTDCDTEEIVLPVIRKSETVTYKNVVDVLEGKSSAADILGEKKKSRGVVDLAGDDKGGDDDPLSFDRIAAACTEYRESTLKTFAMVCEDISNDPNDCKTDLLGDEKVADPDLLNPVENPNVDIDTFVETRQHFPQIFQFIKE